ncbi:hypothetical protein Clacol_005309 [Clathrus columnatus]|uniref:Protein kinase domain-containing protein n=1 Tax=Clathrus columnatus TaxID=1419009 RepID=A0AAV5AD70_9AGAM|nr:hypothetical protein Clacol_005309 [Clathrus columnatus]
MSTRTTRSSAQHFSVRHQISDETISINWCFLSSECPQFKPDYINIPKQLYERPSKGCQEIFCKALREDYEFIAKPKSIEFWRPVNPLSDEATEEEWGQFLNVSNKRSRIPWTRPFQITLDNLENKDIIHLIVTAKALGEHNEELDVVPPLPKFDSTLLKEARRRLYSNKMSVSPSDGAKPSTFAKMQLDEKYYYYCGRPYSREYAVPLTLLHPVFAQFVDDCKTIEFTSKDMDFAFDLKMEMSAFFDGESSRREKFYKMMKEIYAIEFKPDSPISPARYEMGGYISHNGRPILIAEVKNEMAGLTSEPILQALLYYMEVVKALSEDVSSCHPCFTLILVGPFIGFGGSTTTHLKAIDSLRGTYNQLPVAVSEPVSRIFPYQRTYSIPGSDNSIEFSYEADRKHGPLIFDGQTTTGVPICIKFVRKYGQDAHELCAKNKFAPRLYGVEKLPGGWMMIIMERMDETWTCLLDLKKQRNKENKALDDNEKTTIEKEVSLCLELLHGATMVHGDIRDTNILVKKDDLSQVRVIDFDWADKEGVARYPKFVNVDPDIGRPKEVEAFGVIKADHDNHMVPGICN